MNQKDEWLAEQEVDDVGVELKPPVEIDRKVEKYVCPAVRDVLVLDPTNAPNEPGAILEWLGSHVI